MQSTAGTSTKRLSGFAFLYCDKAILLALNLCGSYLILISKLLIDHGKNFELKNNINKKNENRKRLKNCFNYYNT